MCPQETKKKRTSKTHAYFVSEPHTYYYCYLECFIVPVSKMIFNYYLWWDHFTRWTVSIAHFELCVSAIWKKRILFSIHISYIMKLYCYVSSFASMFMSACAATKRGDKTNEISKWCTNREHTQHFTFLPNIFCISNSIWDGDTIHTGLLLHMPKHSLYYTTLYINYKSSIKCYCERWSRVKISKQQRKRIAYILSSQRRWRWWCGGTWIA